MNVNDKILIEISNFLQYMDLLSEEGYEKSEANSENLEIRVGKESIQIPVSQRSFNAVYEALYFIKREWSV